jgi:hypothetical protein
VRIAAGHDASYSIIGGRSAPEAARGDPSTIDRVDDAWNARYERPVRTPTSQEDITLIDVLIAGFEKNEVLDGFHWRDLPMPDEDAARRKFLAFGEEVQRWKGAPLRTQDGNGRRIAAWADLEIRQAGRGVMVRVRAPWFSSWWHEKRTWEGDPMDPIYNWLNEEEGRS